MHIQPKKVSTCKVFTSNVVPFVARILGYFLKVGFFQKVLAKFSNFSKCHSCEPKIVSEHLFPVNIINKILVLF